MNTSNASTTFATLVHGSSASVVAGGQGLEASVYHRQPVPQAYAPQRPQLPAHVVCEWIGNSQKVAAKHYLQVPEEHFKRAAQNVTSGGSRTLAKPSLPGHNGWRTETWILRSAGRRSDFSGICRGADQRL